MKLVYEATGKEVKVGDRVIMRNQKSVRCVITAIQRPHTPASTGRVYVAPSMMKASEGQGYFPGVFDMEWIEREDRHG